MRWITMAALLFVAGVALGHDIYWSGTIEGTGIGSSVELEHPDADPWAGWIHVEVTNSGDAPWGDFHFGIFDPMGGQDIANVDWITDPPFEPYGTQSPLAWVIDDASVGATIDLSFYSDPVLPGEAASFHVYNVNPDHLSFFGVCFYPTPVPEPAALGVLALAALLRRR